MRSSRDDETARKWGLIIDPARVLPDVILMSVGDTGEDTHTLFLSRS